MDLITLASIEKHKESQIDEGEILEPQIGCCIYKVHKGLRRENEESYAPSVISIGPLHHGKKELAFMEKQKVRFKREFSERITLEIWQDFINLIGEEEQAFCNCYEEMPKLKKLDFFTMILYDAVFIIELFLREFYETSPYPARLFYPIQLDLQLLENQIPYFILEKLFKKAFPNCNFLQLSCHFFMRDFLKSYRNPNPRDLESVNVKHFTDLTRLVVAMKYRRSKDSSQVPQDQELDIPQDQDVDIPCATKLHQSGLKFKKVERECLLDVKFEKKEKKLRIPWTSTLKASELQIPPIQIYDETESVFRNLMALEQCHYPSQTLVCNFIDLMDALINTEEDLGLLVDAEIISNNVGDNVKIVSMFNNLCKSISLDGHGYIQLRKNLKAHYDNRWNHAVATLKRVYFNDLWRGTATVGAIVLLLLALIQTIFSMIK